MPVIRWKINCLPGRRAWGIRYILFTFPQDAREVASERDVGLRARPANGIPSSTYQLHSHATGPAVGDSLVLIFPLAPMLTFTSAVGKLNVRVLWHHHMLLQVISQRYCQVFVKSYNFVFEKIDKEGSPREK